MTDADDHRAQQEAIRQAANASPHTSNLEAMLARITAMVTADAAAKRVKLPVPTKDEPSEALAMGLRVGLDLPAYGPYRLARVEWWTNAPRTVRLEYTKNGVTESPIPLRMDLDQKRFSKHPRFEEMDADAERMHADGANIADRVTQTLVANLNRYGRDVPLIEAVRAALMPSSPPSKPG